MKARHMKRTKRVAKILSLFPGAYLLSYLALSSFGAYAAMGFGWARDNGWRVSGYDWMPAGFYNSKTGRRRMALVIFYAPLHHADRRFWHTHSTFPEDNDPQHPVVFPRVT